MLIKDFINKINIMDKCKNCGATSFIIKNNYKICEYCKSKYIIDDKLIKNKKDDDKYESYLNIIRNETQKMINYSEYIAKCLDDFLNN